jgi:hypothetical protein
MSVINSNPFGPDLPGSGFTGFDPVDPGSSGGYGGYAQGPAPDAVRFGPYSPVSLPIASPVLGVGGCDGAAGSSGSFQSGFGSILNQISNAINSLFAQLGAAFGNTSTSSGSGAAPPPTGSTAETMFAHATAASTGDPHLSLAGTTTSGAAVDGRWDSMRSHADLLDSDSFSGGYRISTQATQPNAKGVTFNASASVTTSGGATTVSMQANGSYSVTSGGANVTLTQGQATSLGNGETVTLNADGSLTVNDTNASGGSIATTLTSNGDGGVDVTTQASNVDLGGYLVNRSDGSPPNASAWDSHGTIPAESFSGYPQLTLAQTLPSTNLAQYNPDALETSLQNIDL